MFPDILGFKLEDALEILRKTGMSIEKISITSPPRQRHSEYDRAYRVVKFKVLDGTKIELLICKPL